MNGPPRLIDASPSAQTRRLLLAGLDDAPRPEALGAAAAALGVALPASAAALTATATATKGLAAAAAPTAATATATAPLALVSPVLKVLALGALAGGLTSTAYVVAYRDAPPAPAASQAAAPPARAGVPSLTGRDRARTDLALPAPIDSAPAVASPETVRGRGSASAASVAAAPPAKSELGSARALSSAGPMGDAEGPLAQETRWIDGARVALAQGDVAGAARLLDAYDRGRRLGVLDREALILRAEVAHRSHRVDEARRLTARFAAAYPNDPRLAHLQKLVSGQ